MLMRSMAVIAALLAPALAPAEEAGPEQCPVMGGQARGGATPYTNADWWPERLDLSPLRRNSALSSPMGDDFDYAEAFAELDVEALKRDMIELMTDSQDWWPADYGNYGPLFVRLSWHAAGTYRSWDGRGGAGSGMQRFLPLGSWPDNANLDKARRLLWPIKRKYGEKISWADLLAFAGDVGMETMGFKPLGFAFGRPDRWEPEVVNWGPESEMLAGDRYTVGEPLDEPLAATTMGLIYVNPEGPKGEPNPLAAAHAIRQTFGNMAMSDEETVALIAGGHTFGKAHGAAAPGDNVGPEPAAAGLAAQGLGWKNKFGSGKGGDTITSGLEGAWTSTPVEWSNGYFDNLFGFEWEVKRGPGGAWQWAPKDGAGEGLVPDAHDPDKSHAPMMFTTDIALREDPGFEKISRRYHEDPVLFAEAFAKAWYKLMHRDMGPVTRCLGPYVPEPQPWQDPVPAVDHALIDEKDAAELKGKILASGLGVSDLVSAAWASASTFRGTDMRGGANGARVRLAPQRDWEVNREAGVAETVAALDALRQEFNAGLAGGKRVSLADTIVLGGCAAIEAAAAEAGYAVEAPFSPGRTDATAEMTDAESFAVLEPSADAFRNYLSSGAARRAEELLVERAEMLTLTAPEMTVLVGGMRTLGANYDGSELGVFTDRPGVLTNDFFVNLLDMGNEWAVSPRCEHFYEGRDRESGDVRWTATAVDLVFGSHSELRALAEVYASDNAGEKFVRDFVAAWTKVMELDRFDLERPLPAGSAPVAFGGR